MYMLMVLLRNIFQLLRRYYCHKFELWRLAYSCDLNFVRRTLPKIKRISLMKWNIAICVCVLGWLVAW